MKLTSTNTYDIRSHLRRMDRDQYNEVIASPIFEARNTYLYSADGRKLQLHRRWNPDLLVNPSSGSGKEERMTSNESTDYIGNKVYVGGTLKRVLTDKGYIEEGVYHYYVKDYLGSTRAVVNSSGTMLQYINYYPFGMKLGDSNGMAVQQYRYTGKEIDEMHGLNLYDYIARFYDPSLGRFLMIDPLAEKYYSVSPYAYCLNNPVNAVDLRGDSVTVLNYGKLLNQHMGLLIQNKEGKWNYYSINGDNKYISGKHTGGRPNDDLDIGEWNSPEEFMNSGYNEKGDNTDPTKNSYGYTEGYILPTSAEQDDDIRAEFLRISINREYNVITNNCATAVQESLFKVGIRTGSVDIKPRGPTINSISPIPSGAFRSIMKMNPKGVYIRKEQK